MEVGGEGRAHGNLGAVHMSLGNNTLAIRCFQEQLDRAKVKDFVKVMNIPLKGLVFT